MRIPPFPLGILVLLPFLTMCGTSVSEAPVAPPPTVQASSPTLSTGVTLPTVATPAPATLAPLTPTPAGFAKKIDVGGRNLYMVCAGTGSPTVILEAGLLGDTTYLSDVILGTRKITRVCAYDRAGLGQSDPAPGTLTGQQLVQDLNILLKNARVAGPYVLVGHSFGGELVRLYASQYSLDVAGMVLVDSASEAFDARLITILPQQGSAWLSDLYKQAGVDLKATDAQMQHIAALPHIPFIVLTADNRSDLWPIDWPADKVKQIEQVWMALQRDMVQLVPNGTQIIVTGSGHNIPGNRPDQVIAAITTVINAVRGKK